MERHIERIFAAAVVIFVGVVAGTLLYFYALIHPGILPPMQYMDFGIAAVLGVIIIELLDSSIIEYGKYRRIEGDAEAIKGLFRLFSYAALIIVLLYILHINVTGLLIGAGFLGIVVGLAAQPTLGNVFGGFTVISAKPFSVGDRITVSTWQYGIMPPSYPHGAIKVGVSGIVDSIGLMYTKIIEDDGTPMFMPNSIINSALIYNHKRAEERAVVLNVELEIGTRLQDFERYFRSELSRNIGTRNMVHKAEVNVVYVGSSVYGVEVRLKSDEKHEESVSRALKRAALRASERVLHAGKG